MKNYYASVGYDGQRFQGFQSQPHGNTVQDHLRAVFFEVFGAHGGLVGVSRTDSGVHALDQRIQFRLNTKIPTEKIPQIINRKLEGVRVHWVKEMSNDFDIRNSKHKKLYNYELRTGRIQPVNQNYCWYLTEWPKAVQKFNEILQNYVGEHDFILFSRNDPRRNLISTCRAVDTIEVRQMTAEHIVISIGADGFLWHMVRYMVSYAVAVWRGLITEEELRGMLSGKIRDRRLRPNNKPAPAGGLYLYSCELL